VNDEWNYDTDDVGKQTTRRVDFYWKCIGEIRRPDGELKYPALMKVVRTMLLIAHGSADVESGFPKVERTSPVAELGLI